jgi:hypothetical protein
MNNNSETDIVLPPNDYLILEHGNPHNISFGRYNGQNRNMYWKVRINNINAVSSNHVFNTFYIMHIKDDIYTKISNEDIDKVLNFNNSRPSWYLNANGYIAATIRKSNCYKVYLHQYIMDVHNEDLSNYEKTVDHINNDKLDNRRENLRLVNMSVQNSNRPKCERRSDACDLPDGISQNDIPKYVIYGKEIINKDTDDFREYFYISNHPKLDKSWTTSKSNKINIIEKLNIAKLKIQELNEEITSEEFNKCVNNENKIDLPNYITLVKNALIFDRRHDDKRYNFKSILKSENIQNELNIFIDNINKKYPELKIEYYTIKNQNIKIENVKINNDIKDKIKVDLPPNFLLVKEKNSYFIQYIKYINKIKINKKIKVQNNNIQEDFNNLILLLNEKYPDYKKEFPVNYIINNIPDNIINNDKILKPIMPINFSICNVKSIDYIQFCKLINNKKCQYKTKITSYDLQDELNKFIIYLNNKYNLNIDTKQIIVQMNNWKTTNTI